MKHRLPKPPKRPKVRKLRLVTDSSNWSGFLGTMTAHLVFAGVIALGVVMSQQPAPPMLRAGAEPPRIEPIPLVPLDTPRSWVVRPPKPTVVPVAQVSEWSSVSNDDIDRAWGEVFGGDGGKHRAERRTEHRADRDDRRDTGRHHVRSGGKRVDRSEGRHHRSEGKHRADRDRGHHDGGDRGGSRGYGRSDGSHGGGHGGGHSGGGHGGGGHTDDESAE